MTRTFAVSTALAAAAFVAGLATEPLGPDLDWVPDLATGWALAAAGVAAPRLRRSPLGPLLALAGLLWFAGNTAPPGVALLYRGPLVLAVLSVQAGLLRH